MARWEKFGMAALLTVAVVGCGKKSSKEEEQARRLAPVKTELSANDLSAGEGCLSFPKLKAALDAIAPSSSMFSVPVRLEISSKQHVRENFQRLLALNLLNIHEGHLSSFEALENSAQDGCTTLSITKTDGVAKDFKIIPQEGGNRLFASAEDGEAIQYELLAPKRVRLTRKYITHDVPCGSEKNNVFVSSSRVIDWSGGPVPEVIDTADEQLAIDSRFLSLASEASGFNEAELYTSAEEGELSSRRLINISKVREMSQMAPRPEIVTCTGVAPPPEPTPDPEEGEQPENPEDPEGPSGPGEPTEEEGAR